MIDRQSPGGSGPSGAGPSPSPARRAALVAVAVVVGVLVLFAFAAGKVAAPGSATFPPAGVTAPPAGAVAADTRAAVAAALGSVGLQAEDFKSPYRPAEAARFATAPRIVVRAILPSDPDHGLIVIYEFVSPTEATDAANEQAAYLASGVGRVQFPPDTQFTLRVVGSTAVFYAYSAASSSDSRAAQIGPALATLGAAITIPN